MQYSRRSHEFDEYLRLQPPERRRELMNAEKNYAAQLEPRLGVAEEVFQESMRGLEERPASRAVPVLSENYAAVQLLGGDWSWRPYRYTKDPGHIFSDTEIEALYPGRVYRPNARLL